MNCKNKTHSCNSCGERKCGSKHNCHSADMVRHGEWIEHTYGELKCSVCGIVQEDYPHRYNYCPNCGAKMDAERKQNEQR